jgi:hypothetical protein
MSSATGSASVCVLPELNLSDLDVELEAKEAAERVSIRRTVRRGRDAWELIQKSESYEVGPLSVQH